ncbi:MAG: hypothetical protein WDM85_07190 [Caulobacteraceae bacterium]
MYYLSDRVGADEALRLGLANWVCEPEELAAQDPRDRPAPGAWPDRRLPLHEGKPQPGDGRRRRRLPRPRASHHVHCGQTQDHREASKAFVEKREPVFVGR